MDEMSELSAVVENGRVSVEVDYPDGTELTVNVESSDPFAHFTEEQHAELEASLAKSEEDIAAGRMRPVEDYLAELRAR